jgi:hypothetical protein
VKIVYGKPKYKGKPKRSTLDNCEPYLVLKQLIAAGKIGVQEQVGVEITEDDADQLGVKNAARFVKDHLHRFLRKNNLATDYRVTARALENGNILVAAVFEPPTVVQKLKKAD